MSKKNKNFIDYDDDDMDDTQVYKNYKKNNHHDNDNNIHEYEEEEESNIYDLDQVFLFIKDLPNNKVKVMFEVGLYIALENHVQELTFDQMKYYSQVLQPKFNQYFVRDVSTITLDESLFRINCEVVSFLLSFIIYVNVDKVQNIQLFQEDMKIDYDIDFKNTKDMLHKFIPQYFYYTIDQLSIDTNPQVLSTLFEIQKQNIKTYMTYMPLIPSIYQQCLQLYNLLYPELGKLY